MTQAECANVTGKVNGNVASAPCGDSDAHMVGRCRLTLSSPR
jgi:hypothetical protein